MPKAESASTVSFAFFIYLISLICFESSDHIYRKQQYEYHP